jgi:hypothetical protein
MNMKPRRQVVKLFAVVALAACEKPPQKHTVPQNHAAPTAQPVAQTPPPVAQPAPPDPAPAMAPATPRTLANGKPACGNVAARMAPPPECRNPGQKP